jgi:hypothetical protein
MGVSLVMCVMITGRESNSALVCLVQLTHYTYAYGQKRLGVHIYTY